MSHSTYNRSFWGRFLQPRWPNQHCQSTEGNQFDVKDQAWIPPEPLHHVTIILGNCLYAQHKGPNVTNPIGWTCKNCSYKCAADCEQCHTIKHRAVLIIFPLNLQIITITRMLSSGREGRPPGQQNESVLFYRYSTRGSHEQQTDDQMACYDNTALQLPGRGAAK